MKILHSALMLGPVSGIVNQMRWERAAAIDYGLSWDVKIFCPKNDFADPGLFEFSKSVSKDNDRSYFRRVLDYINFRREYYAWLREKSDNYDAILLRYSTSDPFQFFFIRNCDKPVFLIHHTLEIPELRAVGGFGGPVRILSEKFFGALSYEKARGIVGVTDEIVDACLRKGSFPEKLSYRYTNGVNCRDFSVRPTSADRFCNVPVIIFVASYFSLWHGLDLILDSVAESTSDFILHVVGEIDEKDKIKAINDRRVILHGHVSQAELTALISKADVGLSSFALDRKDMKEACPLKTREYLAQGLPVYAGHRDVFPSGCEFYKIGGPHINEILKFRDQVISKRRDEIAEMASQYIEKRKLVRDFHGWLLQSI
ncbi:glycosyltransferase [Cupriavidus sp. UME77]|uniref:glycosyltransferase n=1 Tax=Cupriavidus sp. UME77 TaxID=1862321 RepID=UPI0015FF7789|nr:glycosyltransferase [Cupriavidus sp. UME77]MBB1634314.1 hypothetical protein [Cupriavidus sp. UME77]